MEPHPQARLFQLIIYLIYRQTSALTHYLKHRIRIAGWLFILVAPASWLILAQHNAQPLFLIRGMILVILGISAAWAYFRKAKLKVTRELPRQATAQTSVSYRVHVQNTGTRMLSGSALLEMQPDNRPSFPLFSRSREPGEETRNPFDRLFCYYRWEWLTKQLTAFNSSSSGALPRLAPGETTSFNLSLTPLKRGVITLDDLRVCLPDPFGIFQQCRSTSNETSKLVVLPHRYRLPLLDILGSARFQLGGEAASSTIGQSGDFTGVREYRPGDPLRHIHWKSWARTGKAIVKEYEDVFFPRYAMVLDTFAAAEDADLFEEAVSIAASFAASIDTRETLLDLMFIHDEAYVFSAGRGEERIDRMLEVLAGVNCEPQHDFDALQKLILSYQEELTACICIFTGWDKHRADTVRRLHQSGLELKVISICRSHEQADDLQRQLPSPIPVQWLRAQHIEEDLLVKL